MFKLPPLPYAHDALSPTISDATMHVHHDRHHAKYIDTLNALLADRPELSGKSMEDVVLAAHASGERTLFNQAGQAWNHAFFWECMAPEGQGGAVDAALSAVLETSFAGVDGLRKHFTEEGVAHFGSGWVWLVARGETLSVISTHDADTALVRGEAVPLLVCDLWEHAYYLDYKQDRKGFLEAWFDTLVNWSFVAQQFEAARDGGGGYRFPT